jgi:hypothetical protein
MPHANTYGAALVDEGHGRDERPATAADLRDDGPRRPREERVVPDAGGDAGTEDALLGARYGVDGARVDEPGRGGCVRRARREGDHEGDEACHPKRDHAARILYGRGEGP